MQGNNIGWHDVGGVPVTNDQREKLKMLFAKLPATGDVSYSYWEREVHGLLIWLVTQRWMSVDELRRGVEGLEEHVFGHLSYYEKWTAAITAMLIEKRVLKRGMLETSSAPPVTDAILFSKGDWVQVRDEDAVRRWRKPHLRIPGYVHGATGRVVDVIGAFTDPAYAAFGEPAPPQPLYRVSFRPSRLWGSTSVNVGGGTTPDDLVECDIFQPWLIKAVDEKSSDVLKPSSPVATASQERWHTECVATASALPDPPLRSLAEDLIRTLENIPPPTWSAPPSTPFRRGTLRAIVERLDGLNHKATGAKLCARAWVDPSFKSLLLADASQAAKQMGVTTSNYTEAADVSFYPQREHQHQHGDRTHLHAHGTTVLKVVENDQKTHHLVVCTLCSCYPIAMLGLSPEWYKSSTYRALAVREPRALLRDVFGLVLPTTTRIVVHDATAEVRYLVLPSRPRGTEGWSQDRLASIITRDCMIGVAVPEEQNASIGRLQSNL